MIRRFFYQKHFLSATQSLGCGLKTGFSGCETEKSLYLKEKKFESG
jgi:hypothetical protein